MEPPSLRELDTLKYAELQKLAKAAGLKANMKADRLLRILKKHFHPAFGAENSSSDSDGNSTLPDDIQGTLDEEQVSICHVTLRRGRAKKENHADSSPEVENKVKTIQGDGAEKDAAETSISTSLQQDQPDEPQENIVVTAKVAKKRRSKGKSSSGRKLSSKIPKSSGKSKAGSKPSTPNFKRLHEAHFKKMESIDKYLERKQKRLDAITTSIQEVKMLTEGSEQLSLKKTPGSNSKKSLPNRFSLLSPKPQTSYLSAKTPANQRSAGKRSILVDKSGVKPSTFSSSKMNVRFSGATKDNEHKYSLVKTPARKSSTFLPNADNSEARKSLPLAKKKPAQGTEETNTPAAVTPFKFTAENVTTPNTNKKMKFDLQASLSRPLGYQPYKGKLKPWGETKENKDAAQNRSSMLKNNYKQPPASTRDERRKQHEKDRKNQRDKTLGSRRGVAVL